MTHQGACQGLKSLRCVKNQSEIEVMKESVLVCRRLLFGVEVDGTKKKKIDIAYGKKRCVLLSLYYPLFFFNDWLTATLSLNHPIAETPI